MTLTSLSKTNLTKRYSYLAAIDSYNVKTVADGHRLAAIITSSADKFFRGANVDDFK